MDRAARSSWSPARCPEKARACSTTNLAIVYAQRGKSVLLIDGDLRTPVLHQSLNLNQDDGLSSLLIEGR